MLHKMSNLERQSVRNIAKVKQDCEETIKRHQNFIDQVPYDNTVCRWDDYTDSLNLSLLVPFDEDWRLKIEASLLKLSLSSESLNSCFAVFVFVHSLMLRSNDILRPSTLYFPVILPIMIDLPI